MTTGTSIVVVEADFDRPEHQQAIRDMLDAYASDPMGGSVPLSKEVKDRLLPGLRAMPTTHVLLAFHDARPVGIATCFLGFSTFAARPLLNLHDLAVIPEYRGTGIGRQLLEAVEAKAKSLGCCRVTLEVLEENPARRLYESIGYASPEYYKGSGPALFLAKAIQ